MKTNGYWVYTITTPDGMVYSGMSCQQYTGWRWREIKYRYTSLYPYIVKFGFDNLVKEVVRDGLSMEEAMELEDKLIVGNIEKGTCINERRSGCLCLTEEGRKELNRSYHKKHREKRNAYSKRWHEEHKEEVREKARERSHKYYEEHKEKCLEYRKEYENSHKEKCREYKNKWKENNREKVLEQQRRYRARKKLMKQIQPDGCLSLL